MTFKQWAKCFNILGWMNYAVAALNIGVIGLFVYFKVPIPWMNILLSLGCLGIGWLCFKTSDNANEISNILGDG
jgi:hypothetical protein